MTSFNEMALASCKYKDKLKKLAEPLYQTFGINYYFYLNITHTRQCSFIGSDPDLVQHYVDDNMHLDNPFFTKTHQVRTGLYLYDSVQHSDFQTTMDLLEKKYNAKHSCLITHKDEESCRIYGFAVPSKQRHSESLMINHSPMIKEFTNFFEKQMKPVLKKIQEQPVDMKTQMDFLLNKGSVNVPDIHLGKKEILNFFSKISNHQLADYNFSSREMEIIHLLPKGMTMKEISDDLKLSPRTIEHYIENIKNKLGCNKRSEVLELLNPLIQCNFFSKAS